MEAVQKPNNFTFLISALGVNSRKTRMATPTTSTTTWSPKSSHARSSPTEELTASRCAKTIEWIGVLEAIAASSPTEKMTVMRRKHAWKKNDSLISVIAGDRSLLFFLGLLVIESWELAAC